MLKSQQILTLFSPQDTTITVNLIKFVLHTIHVVFEICFISLVVKKHYTLDSTLTNKYCNLNYKNILSILSIRVCSYLMPASELCKGKDFV